MKPQPNFKLIAKNLIQSEIKRRGLDQKDVAQMMSIPQKTFNSKLSRGAFSMAFALEVLKAIGVKQISFNGSITINLENLV